MVTPVEKRSSNKFCDFHNDKRTSSSMIVYAVLKQHIRRVGMSRSFYKSMDEFHDRKVIITVQWYHWKVWNKRNQVSGFTIHDLWDMLKFPLNIGLISGKDIRPFDRRKGARPRNVPKPSKQRWQSQMKRKWLSTPAKGYIAIPKCHSPKGHDGDHIPGHVEGMFLGYMISPEGIKWCPDKTKAVLQLPSPRTIKEVQSLNGKLASLNRFLSKSGTSLQATEAALVEATPTGSTQTEGRTDCITVFLPQSY
ncbi:hypothetical protein Tco_0627488 [Tanacetum coccineum]|uniref:Uncharacterized protein n=1 Tax=Tanacetum coccineum TaxID=301880 RepID=A0ABQ4WMN0_9ASTR